MSCKQTIVPAHRWLAQCAISETNRPAELEPVMWVIRNRVESPRYPSTYFRVVTQPMQFSAYNAATSDRDDEVAFYSEMQDRLDLQGTGLEIEALDLAEHVIESGHGLAPFGTSVLHFFSPVSMKPKGQMPSWSLKARRVFSLPPIKPARFIFCEGVP